MAISGVLEFPVFAIGSYGLPNLKLFEDREDNTYITSFILFLFDIFCEICQTGIGRVGRHKTGLIFMEELTGSEMVVKLVVDDPLK